MSVFDVMEANDWDSDKAIQSLLDRVSLLERQRAHWKRYVFACVKDHFKDYWVTFEKIVALEPKS